MISLAETSFPAASKMDALEGTAKFGRFRILKISQRN
jgi:hypothetical protein